MYFNIGLEFDLLSSLFLFFYDKNIFVLIIILYFSILIQIQFSILIIIIL